MGGWPQAHDGCPHRALPASQSSAQQHRVAPKQLAPVTHLLWVFTRCWQEFAANVVVAETADWNLPPW